jgi:hypothetical protein
MREDADVIRRPELPWVSPPAGLSTASTGRSPASISLEYRVLTNAGLATPDVVARSGDRKVRVQVRDRPAAQTSFARQAQLSMPGSGAQTDRLLALAG